MTKTFNQFVNEVKGVGHRPFQHHRSSPLSDNAKATRETVKKHLEKHGLKVTYADRTKTGSSFKVQHTRLMDPHNASMEDKISKAIKKSSVPLQHKKVNQTKYGTTITNHRIVFNHD